MSELENIQSREAEGAAVETTAAGEGLVEEFFSMKMKADVLKQIIEAVRTVSASATFRFSKTGFMAREVDTAHVMMVDLDVDAKVCEEYSAGEVEICPDLDKMSRLLSLAAKEDIVSLSFDMKKEYVLHVAFGSIKRKMALISMHGRKMPKTPSVHEKISAVFDSKHWHDAVKAARQIIDHVYIHSDVAGKRIRFSAEELSETMEYAVKGDLLKEMYGEGSASAAYSIDYIESAVKAAGNDVSVKMQYDNDSPIWISYGLNGEHCRVMYAIAPRIETD